MKVAESLIAFFSAFTGASAYLVVLLCLLVCGLGVPIPEDITLVSAGILASAGNISLEGAMIVGIIGVLAGDAFLFFVGRKYGPKVFTWPGFRKIFTPARISSARIRIHKDAKLICFIARFLPGLRSVIYLTAGTMGVKRSTFLLQDGMAAMVSVPLWVYVGYVFGQNLDYLLLLTKKLNISILVFLVLLVVIYFVATRFRKKST